MKGIVLTRIASQLSFLAEINSRTEDLESAMVVLTTLNYAAQNGKELQQWHPEPFSPFGPCTLFIPQSEAKIKPDNSQRSNHSAPI
jgi:hypothetical protein